MNPDWPALLTAVAAGTLSPAAALAQMQGTVGDFAHVDRDRAQRTGFPEAIFCPGKTPAQIVAIAQSLQATPLLLTRLSPEVHQRIAPT
ncbi:MAG: 1-(5-phosphoribosyl)-5-amino-4-imidazole-carboxylate carboxylase, partial [Oscillatoriales cyanobacterium SM2_1_8]|nr:1-(5-phosphoribosyl)-5-amino-4-imidazole-carboxylate carboxylase [Oscillatoriales cyanobacterium SM2_1_8]